MLRFVWYFEAQLWNFLRSSTMFPCFLGPTPRILSNFLFIIHSFPHPLQALSLSSETRNESTWQDVENHRSFFVLHRRKWSKKNSFSEEFCGGSWCLQPLTPVKQNTTRFIFARACSPWRQSQARRGSETVVSPGKLLTITTGQAWQGKESEIQSLVAKWNLLAL